MMIVRGEKTWGLCFCPQSQTVGCRKTKQVELIVVFQLVELCFHITQDVSKIKKKKKQCSILFYVLLFL